MKYKIKQKKTRRRHPVPLLLLACCLPLLIVSCSVGRIPYGRYFESSWETDTGKSDRAVMDGGKWDHRVTGGGIDYMEVISELHVPGVGVILPVDGSNMLSIGANGAYYENVRVYEFIREHDEHTYLRFYMLVLRPGVPTANWHGIQDIYCPDGEGSLNFYVYTPDIGDEGWFSAFAFRSEEDPSALDYFGNGRTMAGSDGYQSLVGQYRAPVGDGGLDYYRWYRFEVHIHWLAAKTSSTPTLYYMRVYDDTGRLVVDEHNLYSNLYDCSYQNTPKTLAELYSLHDDSRGRRQYMSGTHRCLMFGTNGFGSADEPRLFLIDKVAFGFRGWIGE